MTLKRLGLASMALLTAIVAAASPPRGPVASQLALATGSSPLMAFGGRSPAQLRSGFGGKLDATLADLASHAAAVRPGHELEDLHSLSPAAHFVRSAAGTGPLVSVDAVTRGDPRRLEEALIGLGLQHPAIYRNDVGGWLPVSAIEAAAARGEVASLRAALWHTRAVVATQGDFAQGTATLRRQHPTLTGSGVTVGILSDSYDCYAYYAAHQGQPGIPTPSGPAGYAPFGFTADAAADVASGALPAGVDVLQEANFNNQGCVDFGFPIFLPFADEGRAMLQIVHAVAPGAKLAFYTASNSEADFANGIHALANAGARVIADDVGYFDEPFFQDGLVAQAIDAVQAAGVTYFSAAGNNGNLAYDDASAATHFTIAGSGAQAGEQLLDFGAGTSALTINVPRLAQGDFIALVVEWDQPYLTGAYPGNPGSTPGASSQIDLCVSSTVTYSIFNLAGTAATCTGANALGTDPVQVLVVGNPANAAGLTAAGTVSVSVGLANGTAPPGRIKVAWEDNGAGSTFANSAQANGATIQGHPSAKGSAAVGAAFFVDTPLCGLVASATLEYFSSFGGTSAGGLPVLFDVNGSRLAQPDNRQKPDFVGPDGTNTTFFGFPIADTNGFYTDNSTVAGCANNASFPNYFGTSAATPHAAGAAALMLQANPGLTPTQIVGAMQSTAAPMDNPSPDSKTGYGFLQVGTALDALPAGPPMISVSPTSITLGQSANLTWDGINATSCTGSGALSTAATSGSTTVTPTTTGTQTYTLTCSNAQNTQAVSNSAVLTVSAAPPGGGGGHGGGALGGVTLLVLASLLLARLVLYPPSVSTSANTKPSRSTTSPTRTAMGAGNIGPADTTV
ncbi:MAG TPA: S8 family serine peptidase [Steroidobacteraceae bacterium]|nr:S8 family serine peptidase [Steroidobacteraceae bacterium]